MFVPGPRLQERQDSRTPCPSGNGTVIGDEQQFIVHCNTRFRGDELFRQKTDSLKTCALICTSFQNPRCEGAQFRGNNDCVLIGGLVPEGTRPSRFTDSAAALFPQPGPTSSCSQQGSGTTFLSQNSSFTLQCGKVVNGKDLEQQFHMTLESCLAACSANPACGGVTFDPAQSAGFKNCYLKTTIDDADVLTKPDLDSAILVNGANQAADGDMAVDASTSAVASIPTIAGPGGTVFVTVIPDSGTAPGSVVTVSVSVTATSAPSSGALADSTPDASTAAASAGDGRGDANAGGRPRFGNIGPSTSSNAWIAAPVIGGIAALTLILAVFVLWGRRRRRDNKIPSTGGKAGAMPRAAIGNFGRGLSNAAGRMSNGRIFRGEKTRLGSSDADDDGGAYLSREKNSNDDDTNNSNSRGGFKVVSGSGRRLGPRDQEVPGTGPGLGGMIVTTGGGKIVATKATRPSSPAGSAGLRDSQNGLRQNRLTGNWLDSQPGIPTEFRGPGTTHA